MAKKRRKRSGVKAGWNGLIHLIQGSFRFVLRIVPFFLILAVSGYFFFGVRKLLYADTALSVQSLVVEPSNSISITERQRLETRLVGRNILKIDLEDVARELQRNPEIQTARVVRSFPSQVKIQITRREPIALVQFAPRGPFGLVSEDGVILDVLVEENPSLVSIEAYHLGIARPSLALAIENQKFFEVIKFLKAFWTHALARQETISKITLDHLGNISVILGQGPQFNLGRNPASRLDDLEKAVHLIETEGRNKVDYVDLQFENVIVKRKKT